MNKYLKSIFDFFISTEPQSYRRNYDAAKTDRLRDYWMPISNATAEQTDSPYRQIIKNRARDLERNSDITQAVLQGFTRNVIGNGINVQSKILTNDNQDYDELNDKIEKLWRYWTKPRSCDIAGQLSFTEIQKVLWERKFVDGDIFVIKVYDKTSKIPLKLQLVESDMLDTSINFQNENGTKCIQGIEMDANNKPLAYHFKKNLDFYYQTETDRIPADKVIHLFKKSRPSQIMGVSELAPVMDRIKSIQDFLEAEMIAQRIAACFALFVESENGQRRGSLGRTQDGQTDEERIDRIAPGLIEYLKPGEKISAANPGRNSANAKDFIETQLRLIGAGLGLSYEAFSRSMVQVNFSSARQSMLEDRKTFQQHQNYLIEHFCREVYTEFVISCLTAKLIDIPDFWQDKDRYLAHQWVTSGWTWIDPEKEVKAIKEELKSGMTTLANVASSHGKDWKEILIQRAREQKFAEELGLKLDVDETDILNPPIPASNGGANDNETTDD